MAAGLPVVVSDWDGYKDTVRDGVDGFRIPAIMPQAGLAADLALRHALELDSYDMYCGHTCMLIAVDIEATTLAFEALFKSEDLRQKMGQSGRLRARSVYDWRIIIYDYDELWAELSNKRRAHPHQRSANHRSWPARMDPFDAFSSYPTSVLTPQTSLSLVDKNTDAAIKRSTTFRRLSMVAFANVILPSEDQIVAVINRAKLDAIETPITASEWVRDISDDRRASVFRSLAWFLKIGIMRCHVSV